MLCNLAYVKNVRLSITRNRLIYPVNREKCKVHNLRGCLYKFKERTLRNTIQQEVVRNKTIKTIFQTYGVAESASLRRFQQLVRYFNMTILLSGKSKLCEKRRINIENNRSPYLQCWPSWHESTCAVLPSDIDGAKIITIPSCTVITWHAENRYFVPLPGFYTRSPVGRPHLVRSLRFIPESVFYMQSVMLLYPIPCFTPSPQSTVHVLY